MARPFRERKPPINPKALIFPLLMGTVGWFALRGGGGRVDLAPTLNQGGPTVVATNVYTSSTLVVLEASSPKQDRDERFIYNVERGTVEATSTEPGWRIRSSSAQLTRRTEDGAWLLMDRDASVVLRDRRGTSYKDPVLVGAFDKDIVAIAATASDRRVLLSVARNGSIRELASLSDQTSLLNAEDGRVWLVEGAPQEGIEIPPHGPSSVWSVDRAGSTSTRFIDERADRLVDRVVARGSDVALETDRQDVRVVRPGRPDMLFDGQPLAWLPDHRLVLIQRGSLCFLNDDLSLHCGPKAPDRVTAAYLLTP